MQLSGGVRYLIRRNTQNLTLVKSIYYRLREYSLEYGV